MVISSSHISVLLIIIGLSSKLSNDNCTKTPLIVRRVIALFLCNFLRGCFSKNKN